MKHIEKIMINNARRLGENIEIDFGTGATIILAPNGTGKTTIFEALELAITGGIKRIENFPDAIIRNGLSEMSVRLNFSGAKYCEVNYTKGGACKKEGNYIELFETENQQSLPYLFRLTHFLEQRCKEWLVEQNDRDAGNLLNQLPLGKDLQNIMSKKISFVRAIGVTETHAENSLNEAKKTFLEFEKLIAKRDGLATFTTLIPLEEIIGKLRLISKLINYEEYGDEHNVALIDTYSEKIKVSLKQKDSLKKDLVIRLNALKERVLLYVSNLELLSYKQAVISEYSSKIAKLKPVIEATKKEIQDAKDSLPIIKDEINKLNTVKSMFELVEQKKEVLGIKETELKQNEKVLDELKKSYEMTIEYLKKNERLRDQHKLVEKAIEKEQENLTQTELKRDFQRQWQDLSMINQEILEKKIPGFEKQKNEYLKLISSLDNDVSKAEKLFLAKKNVLESLNKATGAIQDAVSNIRKHLAENQEYCPVCQANYEPSELIKRIEVSLNKLNPATPLAIIEEKDALAELEAAKEKRNNENQKLLNICSELNVEHDKLDANQKKISESFLPQFPSSRTPTEANTYIEEQIAQISSRISELKANKIQLEPEVATQEIDNANLQKSEAERSISELTTKNRNLQNEIKMVAADIININESLIGKEKETISEGIYQKSIHETEKIEFIQKVELTLFENDAELTKCQESLLSENEIISKIKGNQEGIYTEWRQAGLEGQPNEEELKIKCENILKDIDELEKASTSLNIIEQDLASWRTAEKFQDAENEIKKQIGDSSEKAYFDFLKSTVDKKNNILLKIQEKHKAVNLFFSKVARESEQINEQLNSINDPWKRLLKRIVINPLIATAPLLNNSTSRNKLIAKTSAIIHKQNTDIANIASEAQLTDLQLTLMLSMANKYQWTPWKALLLDDPTQHHDLVHASSVFDVLRDYIIDLDYQVMMSTHDSIQAKFFQRKLENEGVPSKIYQLVARKDGVSAERMV
jgi:exonuclease SbcC